MLSEQNKDKLAKMCNFTQERYGDKVKQGAEKEYPHLQDEIAILRKQQAEIIQWIYNKFSEDVGLLEFTEYNNIIENIKEISKEELSI